MADWQQVVGARAATMATEPPEEGRGVEDPDCAVSAEAARNSVPSGIAREH